MLCPSKSDGPSDVLDVAMYLSQVIFELHLTPFGEDLRNANIFVGTMEKYEI